MRTIALLVSLQTAEQSPSCNTSELVVANADVAVAQALIAGGGRRDVRMARTFLKAARERQRAAAALCAAAQVPGKANPFGLDDQPDPFDLAHGADSESAFSDAAFFRAVVEYAADFGPKVKA